MALLGVHLGRESVRGASSHKDERSINRADYGSMMIVSAYARPPKADNRQKMSSPRAQMHAAHQSGGSRDYSDEATNIARARACKALELLHATTLCGQRCAHPLFFAYLTA
jgi:hypothetical protein